MDFDTTNNEQRQTDGRLAPACPISLPGSSDGNARRPPSDLQKLEPEEDFRIPAGSRKSALVYLGLAAYRAGLLDPKELGEVRGRDVDEAGLQRALYRSSVGEIEHVLGPILKGRKVVVEGHLAGAGRTALERLGAEVEELQLEDEKRYIDMTPVIFVFAAVAMAVRYISLDWMIRTSTSWPV